MPLLTWGLVTPDAKAIALQPNAGADYETAAMEAHLAVDVTGDGIPDTVKLVGHRENPDSFYALEHTVEVMDGSGRQVYSLSLGPESGGYAGELTVGDCDGDGIKEILIGLPTGGSGGIVNYYLVSAVSGYMHLVTGSAPIAPPAFSVDLIEGYKARVRSLDLDRTYTLDLRVGTEMGFMDIYREVYSSEGRLLAPHEGVVDPYGLVELKDVDGDGRCELVGYQSIWAVFHANAIGTVRSVWRWNGTQLGLSDLSVNVHYTPQDYAADLARLEKGDPVTAFKQALTIFVDRFKNAPPTWYKEAMNQFFEFTTKIQIP